MQREKAGLTGRLPPANRTNASVMSFCESESPVWVGLLWGSLRSLAASAASACRVDRRAAVRSVRARPTEWMRQLMACANFQPSRSQCESCKGNQLLLVTEGELADDRHTGDYRRYGQNSFGDSGVVPSLKTLQSFIVMRVSFECARKLRNAVDAFFRRD